MTLKFKTCEKRCVEWSVTVPRMNKSVESPSFYIGTSHWNFKMETGWHCSIKDEKWTLYFEKVMDYERIPNCFLTLYIRNKSNAYLLLGYKAITSYKTEIWTCTQNSFLRDYPSVEFVRNTLTLLLEFNYMISNIKDIHPVVGGDVPLASGRSYEHKSVQTSLYLDDHLCLKNLSLDLRKLIDESSNPDVQLRCGNCIVPAHKIILGARSDVFRTMLQSDMLEGRQGTVEIVDMEPQIFVDFIRHLYTGTVPGLNEENASQLYEAADKYNVKDLSLKCGEFLAENLTRDNVCKILVMANLHSDKKLEERLVSYMLREKIPCSDDNWLKFCGDYPTLASKVLTSAYKQVPET